MLACIACAKPEIEEDGGDAATRTATPSSKGLTSQIKDVLLKFSGTHRQSKGVGGSNPYQHKGHRRHRSAYLHPHYEDEAETIPDQRDQYSYLRAGSSSSTPAWDFGGGGSDSRFNATNWPPREVGDVTVIDDSTEPKEWMAQVEPGVHITFVSLPGGTGNDLKRVRFNREMFNKWQAQKWWGENYDRIMELYNVQRFSRQALHTPSRSDDGERESFFSRVGSTRESSSRPMGMRGDASSYYLPSVPDPSEHILPYYLNPAPALGGGGMKGEATSIEASRTTTSSRDEAPSISISNASDLEMTEWVEQDEPGVYITIRELADGTREIRRVRFSRERFAEMNAKLWWEENFERIQAQYL